MLYISHINQEYKIFGALVRTYFLKNREVNFMEKFKFKKTALCLVLVLTMLTGISLTALADSGTISFGGGTFTWAISASVVSIRLTRSHAAKLEVKGKICEVDSAGHRQMHDCGGSINSGTVLNYNVPPCDGFRFTSDARNYLTPYIDGTGMTTCHPNP